MLSIYCNNCFKLWRNKKDLQRITKIKPYINKCNWEGVNFPSRKDDWKKFEESNVAIAFNVLYAKKEKWPCLKQVILVMISNGEKL